MTHRWIFTLALSLLFHAGCARTLPQVAASTDGRFAVKWSREPGYIVVPDSGMSSDFDCSTIARVPGWDASHPNEQRPSTLQVSYKVAGDAVVMTATAFFGVKANVNDTPEMLARLPRKLVGTYSARLNESVTLGEMAKFGMDPFTAQIVTAKDPAAAHPNFISEVPSIRIELTDQNRQKFTLALHNVSSQAVTGYAICAQVKTGNASCQGSQGSGVRPVIPPGGTIAISYFLTQSGRETPVGFVADPAPPAVVLKGAVFADGTVEGLGVGTLTREGALSLTK